jgi:uncharacterized protein (TIGR00369 family)
MKKIKNPFIGIDTFNCIGCSPRNPIGIKLEFAFDESTKTVYAEWLPNINFQGYHNVLHGGIQATLLDEIASWAIYVVLETGGVTSQMQVRYKKPVHISDGKITVKARIAKHEKRLADVHTELFNGKNELCAEATVQYFVYPEAIAREKFGYPGIDKFF